MGEVHLSGELVCKDADEARHVIELLPEHLELTRSEPGCIRFEVTPTDNALVWRVEERFADERAFTNHQERVASSEWGRATAEIVRRYSIEGLAP